ncbi:hypothetical protein [Chryseobacterium capnotolerans]|uniref:hypothetical protein n=1 Tax=Chryseobacterium capnotolerans TaxID=2759528 RepID=UPI0032119C0C
MKKKIITSAFSNLYTDQRIEKVCRTLYENGYEIELIGNDWNGAEEMQRPYPFSRIHLASKSLKTAYFEFNWKLYHELKKRRIKIQFFMPTISMRCTPIILLPKN